MLGSRVFWTVTRRVLAEYVRVSLRVMTISNVTLPVLTSVLTDRARLRDIHSS